MKLNWMSGQVVKDHKQSDKAHGLLVYYLATKNDNKFVRVISSSYFGGGIN